ncbi:MAG TPA: hypothetical protein VLK65_17800 [Vicinamibacteria bacterium]|nr:hypothetical protein [Vicinamibacteria bacterium]
MTSLTLRTVGSLAFLAGIVGCSRDDAQTFRLDFAAGPQGWVAGFADYPAGQEDFYELEADWRALPDSLDSGRSALYISGNNHSDDLWMYYKGRIGGLDANRLYRVRFNLEIATAVPRGCVGVGGAPGEDVTVKAGASTDEPDAVLDGELLRMNVDKGQQTNPGPNAVVVGDVANSVACGESPRWELEQLSSGAESVDVVTDRSGSVWLFVGTDSGFEATTSLYYTWVAATLEPL